MSRDKCWAGCRCSAAAVVAHPWVLDHAGIERCACGDLRDPPNRPRLRKLPLRRTCEPPSEFVDHGTDGTIYKLGGPETGYLTIGSQPGPYGLWRKRPGFNWQAVDFVLGYAVAPNNTLYVLNQFHELKSLSPGHDIWTTLAIEVRSFSMAPDGTLYALTSDGKLQRRLPNAQQWAPSIPASNRSRCRPMGPSTN